MLAFVCCLQTHTARMVDARMIVNIVCNVHIGPRARTDVFIILISLSSSQPARSATDLGCSFFFFFHFAQAVSD